MTTLFVRHKTADYAAWRDVFDAFAPTAATLGVQTAAVYQSSDDANEITVTHGFTSPEAAQAFAGSPELRAAMHDAGVVGAPTIWFAEQV
jgi:quinol monooxygenase YgiN